MSFFCRLSGKHYWCTPHRNSDNALVQVCYECGAEKPAPDLHNEIAAEWIKQSMAAARLEVARLRDQRASDTPRSGSVENDQATRNTRGNKLVVIK